MWQAPGRGAGHLPRCLPVCPPRRLLLRAAGLGVSPPCPLRSRRAARPGPTGPFQNDRLALGRRGASPHATDPGTWARMAESGPLSEDPSPSVFL